MLADLPIAAGSLAGAKLAAMRQPMGAGDDPATFAGIVTEVEDLLASEVLFDGLDARARQDAMGDAVWPDIMRHHIAAGAKAIAPERLYFFRIWQHVLKASAPNLAMGKLQTSETPDLKLTYTGHYHFPLFIKAACCTSIAEQRKGRESDMRGLTIISRVVIIIMTVCGLRILLQHSLGHGASFDIFLAGAPSPWQTFINQDLVSGLFIVLPWMIYREQGSRPIDIFCWSWMVLWWGNIIVAIYALVALRQSHGDAARMFAGRRAGSLAPVWTAPGMAIRALLILSALAILIYMALLIQQAAEAIAIIGAIFGLAPVALSFLLLAFPASGDKTRAAA